MPNDATLKNSKAAQGYEYRNRLFALERTFESMTDSERQAARQAQSKPLLEEYQAWLDSIKNPTGKLKEAINYARNQRAYLETFLDHGEIELSNNQVENAIRPFVVGRKGWLFCDTAAGARASAILYTIMETAKVNGLRLDEYIEHLLTTFAGKTKDEISSILDELLPWSEAIQRRFRDFDA